jgi:hypothetical protein
MKLSIPLPEGDSEIMLDLRYCFESGKHYSTCVIKTPHRVVAGAAVLNPKDQNDSRIGFKLAFSRALEQLYPHVEVPERGIVPEIVFKVSQASQSINKEDRSVAWRYFLEELPKAMTT